MAPQLTETSIRTYLLSAGAVLAAVIIAAILALGTDDVLRVLDVYPPWRQPTSISRLNGLALPLRVIYNVFGSYLAAKCDWHRTRVSV